MTLGRPLGSEKRNVIHRILSTIKTSYVYEIWRIMQVGYSEFSFTQRLIYYNAAKGIELGLWTSKQTQVDNHNSWEGLTGRTMLTIKLGCEVEPSEQQMIKEIALGVKKTIDRYKDLKTDFKSGQMKPFRYYYDRITDDKIADKEVLDI